jgi:hypothetical protein
MLCHLIEPVDRANIPARDQMDILVGRDLDRAMTHLVPYIGEGYTLLNQQTAEGVPQVMKTEPTQPCPLKHRNKIRVEPKQ